MLGVPKGSRWCWVPRRGAVGSGCPDGKPLALGAETLAMGAETLAMGASKGIMLPEVSDPELQMPLLRNIPIRLLHVQVIRYVQFSSRHYYSLVTSRYSLVTSHYSLVASH